MPESLTVHASIETASLAPLSQGYKHPETVINASPEGPTMVNP